MIVSHTIFTLQVSLLHMVSFIPYCTCLRGVFLSYSFFYIYANLFDECIDTVPIYDNIKQRNSMVQWYREIDDNIHFLPGRIWWDSADKQFCWYICFFDRVRQSKFSHSCAALTFPVGTVPIPYTSTGYIERTGREYPRLWIISKGLGHQLGEVKMILLQLQSRFALQHLVEWTIIHGSVCNR